MCNDEIKSLIREHEILFEQKDFNHKLIEELLERNRRNKLRRKEIRDRIWQLMHENANMVENGIRL